MQTDLQRTLHPSAPLGQKSSYPSGYDKTLLHPVERRMQRQAMKIPENVEFKGYDVWNAYEILCRNLKGKPMRTLATFLVPANSRNLCESKSVKLYLNSLNHERFSSLDVVAHIIARDLSEICEAPVKAIMKPDSLFSIENNFQESFRCIDDIDIEINHYMRTPELLIPDFHTIIEDKIATHLFKSHCLCTGQPDMGSIFIDYDGPKIDDESMLSYLVSYSEHAGFSENCIEQIFIDIMTCAKPKKLCIFGRFTRRGGIDINPYRSTHDISFDNTRLFYQ